MVISDPLYYVLRSAASSLKTTTLVTNVLQSEPNLELS
jgi:hypothetical protein